MQMTGGSSYTISLPKEWIKSSNIKKNDPLGIIIQPDGSLTLTPELSGKPLETVKEFKLEDIDDPEFLYRSLIGAYVSGFNTIKITSARRIPSYVHKAVRMFTQVSVGQEVSEETGKMIVIKDLLNPGEMPFKSTIQRMYVIVGGMEKDAIFALKSRDVELAKDVIVRDRDVNRLYWLIARQYNLLIKNVSLSREMGMDVEQALNYLQISRVIERMGDQVVKIAENVLTLMYVSIDKKMMDAIEVVGRESLEIFDASIISFYNKDIYLSNNTISRVETFGGRCDAISHDLFDLGKPGVVSIGYIIENLKRVGEYSGVISETVINYLVAEES